MRNPLVIAPAAAVHIQMIAISFIHGETNHPFTVSVFWGNSIALFVTTNDELLQRTSNIERR